MRIGELGELADVSTKTIRYYESLGLLAEPDRTPAGYRDYSVADVERLRFVRDAQSTGLTLSEIASVLELKSSGERSCSHTLDLLQRHLADVDAQIKRLRASKALLNELAQRAELLDPATCTDLNRCQIIAGGDG
jgi:DNA-binding transcriptional MerR regulator